MVLVLSLLLRGQVRECPYRYLITLQTFLEVLPLPRRLLLAFAQVAALS
jgi:hypothetical protein